MDEGSPQKPLPKINDPSVVLFLGLYLILLAFFILLSTISSISLSKSVAVVGSVKSAFRSDSPVDALSGDSFLRALGGGQLDQRFLGSVRASFSSAFPNQEVDETAVGAAVQFVVSADAIFEPGSPAVQDGAGDLLEKLATSLTTSVLGFHNEVEIVLRTGEGLASDGKPEQRLFIERAGLLAREMVANGVRPRAMQMGLRAGPRGTIAFLFRQTDKTATILSFEGQPIFAGPFLPSRF